MCAPVFFPDVPHHGIPIRCRGASRETFPSEFTIDANPAPIGLAEECRGVFAVNPDELKARIRGGQRCIRFEYCVSFVIATMGIRTKVRVGLSWRERHLRGLGYALLSLLLGPWGIPWGPYFTARCIGSNLAGGIDVTDAVMEALQAS